MCVCNIEEKQTKILGSNTVTWGKIILTECKTTKKQSKQSSYFLFFVIQLKKNTLSKAKQMKLLEINLTKFCSFLQQLYK
jgi:hypothetical protein